MRVLNVNMTLDHVSGGGTAERTFQMSRSLIKTNNECTVLILDLGLTSERLKALAGVRVVALPCVVKRYYIPRFSLGQLLNVVREADVVHLMGHWTFINALIYLCARWLRKPYVVCPAGALPIYGRSKSLKHAYNLVIGRKIIRNADGHVAIVGAETSSFETYGVPPEKVTVIPNGISMEESPQGDGTAFRTMYGLGSSPFVLFVGRLNPIKGPDLLLQAFSEVQETFPDYHLVFAGPDNGMLAELRKAAARLRLEKNVHFIGYVGGAMKAEAYDAAELLVVPSRFEAMSIVALEAGAAGTPVLLTDRCGFDEAAAVGGGRVVPASVEGIRAGLLKMLGDSEGLKVMGERLRAFLRREYTWDATVEKYLDLYDSILRGRSGT